MTPKAEGAILVVPCLLAALSACGLSSDKQPASMDKDASTQGHEDASSGDGDTSGNSDAGKPASDPDAGKPPPPPKTTHPWSHNPPGGKQPADVPQLVAVTFDDNFGLANEKASGGVNDIVALYKGKKNPAGKGSADDFDGAPIRTTFFNTSIYLTDESETVLGGKPGEDHLGRNRAAWQAARDAGHEMADHTVNHFNGGVVPLDTDDCCRARNWSAKQWGDEIAQCRDAMANPDTGVGVTAADVVGFRTPFLGYNDALFDALTSLHFYYDTSLPSCFGEGEDGTNCAWPYTLDHGSPDTDALAQLAKSGLVPFTFEFPMVTEHADLWELPPTSLVLPPDDSAAKYDFDAGLRGRVAALDLPLPYPTMFDPKTNRIAGLDYSLLMDAKVTGREMAAILKYNLDLHLSGNRAPIVFVAHSHLYAYTEGDAEAPEDDRDNPDTPSKAVRDERLAGLKNFIEYAQQQQEVRIVAAGDVLAWMQRNSK